MNAQKAAITKQKLIKLVTHLFVPKNQKEDVQMKLFLMNLKDIALKIVMIQQN